MAQQPDAKGAIIDKVRKILTLSDRDRNNSEHEAQRALEMAHALAQKHGLDLAEIALEKGEDIEIEVEDWRDEYRTQYDTWNKHLGYACARLFELRSYLVQGPLVVAASGKYRKIAMGFIGEATDVALAREVWPWLAKHCREMAREFCGKGWNVSHRSFAEAFAMRVYVRADNIATAAEAANQPARQVIAHDGVSKNLCTALVVAAKQDAIDRWMEEQGISFGEKRKAKRRTVKYDRDAAHAGDEVGKQVNLNFNKQVGE